MMLKKNCASNANNTRERLNVHLEAGVHQDVHVGAAADWSLPPPPRWSWKQEQAAERGQPGVWGGLH